MHSRLSYHLEVKNTQEHKRSEYKQIQFSESTGVPQLSSSRCFSTTHSYPGPNLTRTTIGEGNKPYLPNPLLKAIDLFYGRELGTPPVVHLPFRHLCSFCFFFWSVLTQIFVKQRAEAVLDGRIASSDSPIYQPTFLTCAHFVSFPGQSDLGLC